MALPKGYEVPKSNSGANRYMKLEIGQNKFRFLSDIITGYVWWEDVDGSRKPMRAKNFNGVPKELWQAEPGNRPKHFWAAAVWSFDQEAVMVLELTQKTIQETLTLLEHNADWGDLKDYSITITKNGKGRDTVYSVAPSPKKDLPENIKKEYKKSTVNLEKMFEGKNPFASEEDTIDIDIDNLVDNLEEAGE